MNGCKGVALLWAVLPGITLLRAMRPGMALRTALPGVALLWTTLSNVALALLLGGCSLAPDYARPEFMLPQRWSAEDTGQGLAVRWWKRFNDATLNALVDEALIRSQDVAAAVARMGQARAGLGLARANLLPAISAAGVAQSGYVDGNHVTGPLYGDYTHYSAAAGVSWELDLWGRLRNANTAARARLLATEAGVRGVRLGLAAQVAQSYFALLALDAQLEISGRTLHSRQESLRIDTARCREGLISELALKQTQSLLETARTALLRLTAAREGAEGALAALLGRSPQAIFAGRVTRGTATLTTLPAPPTLPRDVPANLLERRPDLVAAEQRLIAANADIGAARAAWLPALSLSAALGTADLTNLSRLFHKGTDYATFGGSAGMPLFDFGRILATVRASEAAKRELAAEYIKTVHLAFADVRAALADQAQSDAIVAALERQTEANREALRLATARWRDGFAPYLDALDAERALLGAEMELAAARSSRLQHTVRVCLALGGGWQEAKE